MVNTRKISLMVLCAALMVFTTAAQGAVIAEYDFSAASQLDDWTQLYPTENAGGISHNTTIGNPAGSMELLVRWNQYKAEARLDAYTFSQDFHIQFDWMMVDSLEWSKLGMYDAEKEDLILLRNSIKASEGIKMIGRIISNL